MGTVVETGIDVLQRLGHPLITGRRIGLVTNPTGITADFRSSIEVCSNLETSVLTALFACEHGLYGELQAGKRVEDVQDERFGVPVFSLYGISKKPTADMLQHVDTVVFDIQDLGVRFYTYLTTLSYVMEACAEHGKSLLVLDRPNPLGGALCEGGFLKAGFESMVGAWTMPIRTGMTIGELARMMNDLRGLGCDLDIVPLTGWNRSMEFTATGLPWMMPSPNIPTMDTVRVYGGTCLFEGTNVSEGRGTTRPFEWIGAPWLDGRKLAERLNGYRLPGVHFHSVYMSPTFSKYQGELCDGVRLFVTDIERFESVRTGLTLLHEVMNLHPDHFKWLEPPKDRSRYFIDLLTGGDDVRRLIGTDDGLRLIVDSWREQAEEWKIIRKSYLLYGEE
ncbi:DUF1343 domain-containing protein [Paenibacillus sediminis]|uniref:Uncharacterized protein YbbC (DUF1343 family) n=1 Tax=Paenibacillus sediminis TaxID=664909 RepID=A0ABS4H3R5_9BACL|nr:DUF1343 domain-containing protein [Paenibacillus sediminis]MBP1937169.1 uncharacterized protein YbbC (DUF1343 family) [Paenibacillus sediminis]